MGTVSFGDDNVLKLQHGFITLEILKTLYT